MKRWNLLIPVLVSLAIFGCAKLKEKYSRKDQTTVEIKLNSDGSPGSLAALNGGIAIYAVKEDGTFKKSAILANEDLANSSLTMTLPNGSYRFYALGFASTSMQGSVKCGLGNNGQVVNLGGIDASVGLTLAVSNCSNAAFSTSDHYDATTGVAQLTLASCANTVSLGGLGYLSNCGSDLGDISTLRSVQVVLHSYTGTEAQKDSAEIKSACFNGAGLPGFTEPVTTAANLGGSAFALDDNTIFLGAVSDGVGGGIDGIYRSTDSGASFTKVQSGDTATPSPGTAPPFDLAFYDITSNGLSTLYAAGVDGAAQGGLYKSTDTGASWTKISNTYNGAYVEVGSFDSVSAKGNVVIGSSDAAHIIFTLNGGTSWTDYDAVAGNSMDDISRVYYDDTNNIFYAIGNSNGSADATLLKSTNNGSTWSVAYNAVGEGDPGIDHMVKIIDGTLFIGTSGGLRFSTDGGTTWTRRCKSSAPTCTVPGEYASFPGENIFDIIKADGVLYTGGTDGVAYSKDNGLTWASMNWGYGSGAGAYRIAFGGGHLYATETAAGVKSFRRSNNKGTGVAFATSGSPLVPVGSGAAGGFLSTSVRVFKDPNCTSLLRTYSYPNGLAGAASTSKLAGSAGSAGRLFLVDF